MRRWQAVAAVLAGLADAVCAALSFTFRPVDTAGIWINLVPMVCFLVAGTLSVRAAPSLPAARWLLAMGVTGAAFVCSVAVSGSLHWTAWPLFLVGTIPQCLMFGCWLATFANYPVPELNHSYERLVVGVTLAAGVLLPVLALFGRRDVPLMTVPVDHPPTAGSPIYLQNLHLLGSAYALLYVAPVGAFVLLVLRYRRADRAARLRLRWPLAACAGAALFFAASALLPGLNVWVSSVLFVAATCAVPLAAGIGLVRPALFDIGLAVRRWPIYAVLWTAIAAVYAALAAMLGWTAGRHLSVSTAVVVTIAAALLFQPARDRLERLADRLVYGRRLDGYQLLRDLGRDLQHSVHSVDLGRRVTSTIAQALDAEWCRLLPAPQTGQPQTTAGEVRNQPVLSTATGYAGEVLGRLECGPRRSGSYTDDDKDVLMAIARQVGLALHDARQTLELAASRTRLVHAAEAERRRIERDLHDGAQQQLIALMTKIELARRAVTETDGARAHLAEAQTLARQAFRDLRELAQGIHPSVLTDQGVPAAVRSRLTHLPIAVRMTVSEDAERCRFSADTEAAAYFLISEALTNVVKHANASAATVDICLQDGGLKVVVQDHGVGMDPCTPLRGLRGVRDRMEALGGRLELGQVNARGTRVAGWLPE